MPRRKPQAPSVTVSCKTAGGTWYARWREPITGRHRRKSLGTPDQVEAEARAAALARRLGLAEVDELGADELAGDAHRTVAAAIEAYLEDLCRRLGKTKHVTEKIPAHLKHLATYLDGQRLVGELRPRDAQGFAVWVAGTSLAISTQREVIATAKRILAWWHAEGWTSADCGHRLEAPRLPRRGSVEYFEPCHVRAAIEAARRYSPDGEGFVLLVLLAGLRASEVCRLLWEHIDFRARQLRIEGYAADPARGLPDVEVKSSAARRTIPLEAPLIEWLEAHRTLSPGPWVMMHPRHQRLPRTARLQGALKRAKVPAKIAKLELELIEAIAEEREEWSCVPPREWVPYRQWPRKLALHIRRAGCPWDCRVGRHTFATMLASRGEIFDRHTGRIRPITTFDLQQLMGHSSVQVTERHYRGFMPVQLELGLAAAYGIDETNTAAEEAAG